MKVLFYIDSLVRGGKERRLVELMKHIKASNALDFELALMSKNIQYPEVRDIGIKIHYLIRKSKKDLRIYYRLFQLCQTIKPDIIHTWDSMTSVYGAPIAKVLGISLVNGMVTDSSPKNNIFQRGWIRRKITFFLSDAVVGNSLAGLKAYKVPERKGVCIYNGFNTTRLENLISPVTIKEKFNIQTPKIVGMVASFSDKKDYVSFLLTAENILKHRRDVTFITIGDGNNLEKCKSMVKLEDKGNIKFLGVQYDIESIINVFDVGVLTTNVDKHGEGVSNSILEYMALGKPVVATDSGGTNEIIVNGLTGFCIPPKFLNTLTQKISELLDNPKQGKEMGDKGRQRILAQFSVEESVQKYINLYQNIIKKRKIR